MNKKLVLAALLPLLLSLAFVPPPALSEGDGDCTATVYFYGQFFNSFVCGQQGQTTFTGDAIYAVDWTSGTSDELHPGAEGFPCQYAASATSGYNTGSNFVTQYVDAKVFYFNGSGTKITMDSKRSIGCSFSSPILVPLGNSQAEILLTSLHGGVPFNLLQLDKPQKVSWFKSGAQVAWLTLDRNGNGLVDDGSELFGDITLEQADPLTLTEPRNGYRALRLKDDNSDGLIDSRDSVFSQLRLWSDTTRNGVDDGNESQTLTDAGFCGVGLNYTTTGRRDRYGNQYRFSAALYRCDGTVTRSTDVTLKVSGSL